MCLCVYIYKNSFCSILVTDFNGTLPVPPLYQLPSYRATKT